MDAARMKSIEVMEKQIKTTMVIVGRVYTGVIAGNKGRNYGGMK